MSGAILGLSLATAAAEPPRDLPVNVSAERGDYDAERGATHLRENIHITRGDLEVHADEGYAYSSDGRYERVELLGSPARWSNLSSEGETTRGEADRIVYELATDRVIMIGNARIQDSRGAFSGNRVVYDVDNERLEGDGGVQLTIEPEARADRDDESDPDPD
ncbi:MAG: lipopolysaccharide transport periplasmic protein LptA [Wenzhouxiangella sp.]